MGKEISIIGCGMGSIDTMTVSAADCLKKAHLVFGPERLTKALASDEQRVINGYQTQDLLRILREEAEERIAVLVSGDSGFYSAASQYAAELSEADTTCTVQIFPGVSSLSFLAARTSCSWSDAQIYSLHGRAQNYYGSLCAGEKFAILGGNGFAEVTEELCDLGFGNSRIWIGERLGSVTEQIRSGTARELCKTATDRLSLMLVQPCSDGCILRTCGIADADFIRGGVPITKSEVRAVTMSRLAVGRRDVVYDIGAGTGSISVEASIAAAYGVVCAIEHKAEALELLEQNRQKFLCRNLRIVSGTAPEALADLPAPDRAFIGGSSGRMREILKVLLEKNPGVHVVINAAALETLQEAVSSLRELGYTEPEISQIAVSRAVSHGKYHLMEGLNPVYVITADGRGGCTPGA